MSDNRYCWATVGQEVRDVNKEGHFVKDSCAEHELTSGQKTECLGRYKDRKNRRELCKGEISASDDIAQVR